MTNLLFEIFSYDIPYDLQIKAEKDIKNLFNIALTNLNIKFDSIISFSSNRRIVLYIPKIDKSISPVIIKKRGPATSANLNIINNFLSANSININQCYKEKTSKGEYYFFNKSTPEILLKDKLADLIVSEVLSKVRFERSMFWNETKVKWARPITNFILMLGDNLIDFSYAGIKSSKKLEGHMFLSNKSIELLSAKDYFKVVKDLMVILPSNENSLNEINLLTSSLPEFKSLTISREQIIINEINKFAKLYNIVPNLQPNLLKELSYLTEFPVVLFAKIPNKYLSLPKELLVDTMVKNQRYINFFNKNDNSISEYFALVSNIKSPDNGKEIIKGNQRVLNARLEDGLFYYSLDIKENWLNNISKLKNISFFEGLGSLFDKQDRLQQLSLKLFPEEELTKICSFCKIDLISKVVTEFPELQGIMGFYYAKNSNFSDKECLAIKEHYMPVSSNSELPTSLLGAKLAILDKLDTLISFFSIGKIPTSSSDPFALRRAAVGIIRICMFHDLSLDIINIIDNNLLNFFRDRLIIYLKGLGVKSDITLAVLEEGSFNIIEISNKALALSDCLKDNLDLVHLFKRVYNIINSANIEYKDVTPELFCTNEEKYLFNSLNNLINIKYIDFFSSSNIQKKPNSISLDRYKNYINDLILLKPEIDLFLNNIHIINHKEPKITINRLSLLNIALVVLHKLGKLELINLV